MVRFTDLRDGWGAFVDTKSPADVNVVVSVPGTEVERVRSHVMFVAGVSPDAGRPSASTAVRV